MTSWIRGDPLLGRRLGLTRDSGGTRARNGVYYSSTSKPAGKQTTTRGLSTTIAEDTLLNIHTLSPGWELRITQEFIYYINLLDAVTGRE